VRWLGVRSQQSAFHLHQAMPSADDLAERTALNAIGNHDVYVRAAKLADSAALIKLNEEFRENMLRWQSEEDDAEYPVLNFDDIEYILTEEDEQNLIVLCEKPSGGRRQARIIGYSYAYEEPWEAVDAGKKGKGKGKGKSKDGKHSDEKNSLYIAEVPYSDMHLVWPVVLPCPHRQPSDNLCALPCVYVQMFVAKSERGRGLGDVLLFETLNRRCKLFPRSHLYVSSRNTTAVAIYNKFGFVQSDKPSGDISHDLVRNCVTVRVQGQIL